jgi:hypothetical protein
MTEFDANEIQKNANELYLKAASTLLLYTVCALALCGLIGYVGDAMRALFGGAHDNTLVLISLIMGGIGGYLFGSEKAFFLKLQVPSKAFRRCASSYKPRTVQLPACLCSEPSRQSSFQR